MKYSQAPSFSVYALEDALQEKFGKAFEEFYGKDLASFLFDDQYVNDSYKKLYIDDDLECDPEADDAIYCWTMNTILGFLREQMPEGTRYVLVDVSW